MSVQLGLGGDVAPPRSLVGLERPVFGVDASTVRVSVACVLRGEVRWETRSLPQARSDEAQRYSDAYVVLDGFFSRLAGEWGRPVCMGVEEPVAYGQNRVHVSSSRMLGVVLAACGPWMGGPVVLMNPNTWKAAALGKGHGLAKKPEILEWACGVAGYTGALQDEADAIGVATAMALSYMR